VYRTEPVPAPPVVNTTLLVTASPGIISPPIVGHVVIALTAPPGAQLVETRVSIVPVFVTVKVTW
jgi:hypothetical protein